MDIKPVITYSDAITPYGRGVDACWHGLRKGKTAIRHAGPFASDALLTQNAALVPDFDDPGGRSRLLSLLNPLLQSAAPYIPPDCGLLLATTTGEIDLLEKEVLAGTGLTGASAPVKLLQTIRDRTGVSGPGAVVSAACASSSAAVARAADMIRTGQAEAVLVVGGDAISEFVFAGFSTLMALSPTIARPFDRNRDGLSLGEAAALALIMHPNRASAENLPVNARICGWGLSSDANHMTGPSRDGRGLADAIHRALKVAAAAPDDIRSICAHGTGTVFNDAMEMKAFKQVFTARNVPVYSVKGGTGHTMGAAGLLEVLITAKSLHDKVIPPCTGLEQAADDAVGWVHSEPLEMAAAKNVALSTNSGFGGVNSALILDAANGV